LAASAPDSLTAVCPEEKRREEKRREDDDLLKAVTSTNTKPKVVLRGPS